MVVAFMSCKSTSESNNRTSSRSETIQQNGERQQRQQRGNKERPTSEQLLAQIDTNKDGKLSEVEVRGPLKNSFSKIDTDDDGFITREELDNAPKPERRASQGGPNIALSANVASGFDYAGGHNGPTGYHYHLESSDVAENTVVSHDDDALVGIMQDGFLLYGRRESTTGDYPDDLDASGGHVGTTPHSNGEEIYHYHIINEIFTGTYIVLFGGDLKGTPSAIQ